MVMVRTSSTSRCSECNSFFFLFFRFFFFFRYPEPRITNEHRRGVQSRSDCRKDSSDRVSNVWCQLDSVTTRLRASKHCEVRSRSLDMRLFGLSSHRHLSIHCQPSCTCFLQAELRLSCLCHDIVHSHHSLERSIWCGMKMFR